MVQRGLLRCRKAPALHTQAQAQAHAQEHVQALTRKPPPPPTHSPTHHSLGETLRPRALRPKPDQVCLAQATCRRRPQGSCAAPARQVQGGVRCGDRACRFSPLLRACAWGSGLSSSGPCPYPTDGAGAGARARAKFQSAATIPTGKPGAEGHGSSFPGSAPPASRDAGLLMPDGGMEGQLVGTAAPTVPRPGPGALAPIGKVLLHGAGNAALPVARPPWHPWLWGPRAVPLPGTWRPSTGWWE